MGVVCKVTCVDRPICALLGELSYRRAIPPDPLAIDPNQLTYVGMGFKTERVLDVHVEKEDGKSAPLYQAFTVYAAPNQYTCSKQKKRISQFTLHLREAYSCNAIRNMAELCIIDYEKTRP